MRKGSPGRGKQVHIGTVRAALGGVNTKIALYTGRQPLHQPGSNDKYILPLQHILKGFENKDPPRVNNLEVHPDLPYWLFKWVHRKGISPQQQAVEDLEMIAFYYLLRVGEYTAPKRRGQRPITQHFSVNDVTFFKLRKTCGFLSPLPNSASRNDLLEAVAATLLITEQKTLFKGACVHHGALERQIFACSVKELSFFLLVRPPRSQSLLIMGCCSSIPEHRL